MYERREEEFFLVGWIFSLFAFLLKLLLMGVGVPPERTNLTASALVAVGGVPSQDHTQG